MLSVPHQKFCEGILSGLSRTAAYAAAYKNILHSSARNHGSRLFRRPHIQAEIARLRGRADALAGSAVLSNVEMRTFLARLVRSRRGGCGADEDADLGEEVKPDGTNLGVRARDKLTAIKLARDLEACAEDPRQSADAEELEAFREIIRRVRSKPWRPGEVATTPFSQTSRTSQTSQTSQTSAEGCR